MSYFKCTIKEEIVETEIKNNCEVYPTTQAIKLGTNLTVNFDMLSDNDRNYVISEIEKLVAAMELRTENEILKEQVLDLNDRVNVLYNAHQIKAKRELSKMRENACN